MSTQCHGVVQNIPSTFHSSDLKNFFSDFVENAKFKCFHYKHRPETLRTKVGYVSDSEKILINQTQKQMPVEKAGTCCCVFETVDDETLTEVIAKYNDANWINRSGGYMKARCVIRRIKIESSENEKPSECVDTSFSNRSEVKYRKYHAESEEFSKADLLALSELQPPTHVMPRGNVGTTTKEFMQLIRECKLPPRIIRKLDLKFPMNGSTRRYGNVHMTYTDTRAKTVPGSNTFTASGDIIEKNVKIEPVQRQEDGTRLIHEGKEDEKNELPEDSGSDDDGGEEWERHEALHNDVTSQERTKERLFEEDIELKWEKGGSGLVFYTDAQFWNEQEGDFEEQNTDDWDIDMSEYYGGKGDLDARQYLEIRREKMRGKAIYDDSLTDYKLGKRNQPRSRSESPPGKQPRGRFEKHTKGVGRKLMEKDGWKEGDPLGPQQRTGAITDPIELDGQNPKIRRGLGYHGEKIVRPHISNDSTQPSTSRVRPKDEKVWGPRSGEPLATHSPFFPQFAFNLPNNTFKERSKASRSRTTPGPDDGIVITTAYDRPLDIDTQDELLRSKHPTALKHRKTSADVSSNPTHSLSDDGAAEVSKHKKSLPTRSTPLHLSSVKFVRGGVLDDSSRPAH